MPSESSLPTWWINLWIVIGCFAFVLFFGVPVLMSRNLALEYQRFQDCRDHRRADCKPSMVWLLSDWKMSTSTAILDTSITTSSTSIIPSTAQPTSTIQFAPPEAKVVKIDLDGVSNENGVYTVSKVGQKITLHVQVENAKRVELFVADPVSSNSDKAFPQKPALILTKQKDGSYSGSWVYAKTFPKAVMLNVRAYPSSQGSTQKNADYAADTVMVAIMK